MSMVSQQKGGDLLTIHDKAGRNLVNVPGVVT